GQRLGALGDVRAARLGAAHPVRAQAGDQRVDEPPPRRGVLTLRGAPALDLLVREACGGGGGEDQSVHAVAEVGAFELGPEERPEMTRVAARSEEHTSE